MNRSKAGRSVRMHAALGCSETASPPRLALAPRDSRARQVPSIKYRVAPFAPGEIAPADELSRLHTEILPTSPAVLMGQHFLESFYYTILPRDGYIQGAVAYVDDVPAGFVVFTLDSDGFMGRAAAHHVVRLAFALAVDTLTNPRLPKHIFESWKLMRSRISANEDLAEIMSIGVHPQYRGHGFKDRTGIHIAQSLHRLALDRLRRVGVKHVRTIVDEDNERSIQYHLNTGWKVFATGVPGWNVPSIELRINPEDVSVQ